MKFVLVLSVLLVVCSAVLAKPQKAKQCTVVETGEKIGVGSKVSVPGKCVQVTCQSDLSVAALTCPLAIKKGCKLGEIDYKKDYPSCCPEFVCS